MSFAAEELADRVRAALPGRLDVREQRMFGGRCFMLNGHMLVGPMKDGSLLVRVGPDGLADALGLPGAGPMTMTGRTMKGFVVVSGDALEDDEALVDWIGRARAFLSTLAPKWTRLIVLPLRTGWGSRRSLGVGPEPDVPLLSRCGG